MPDNYADDRIDLEVSRFDRDLTDLEACNAILVKTESRELFIKANTSPLPEWEFDGDETWIPVFPIRYGGITGGPNRFGL